LFSSAIFLVDFQGLRFRLIISMNFDFETIKVLLEIASHRDDCLERSSWYDV